MTEDGVIPARYGAIPLFLVAAVLAVATPFFWQHVEIERATVTESYENRDLYQFYYPAYHHAFGRLSEGELPLWDPWQLCGHPVHVDPRMGLFQPLNLVFAALPTEQAMAVHAFLCLFLMAFGCAIFLRSLDLKYEACLFGGIAYAFCGAAAAGMSRPDTAGVMAWTPFVFWAVSATRDSGRRLPLMVGGIAAGMVVLSGGLSLAALFIGMAALYAAWLKPLAMRPSRWTWTRRFSDPILLIALALIVSAVQWVPTAIWARGLADPGSVLWGIRFAGEAPTRAFDWLTQVAAATPGSVPRVAYAGVAAIALLPAAFFHRRRWRDTVFFGICAAGLIAVAILAPWDVIEDPLRPVLFFGAAFCLAIVTAIGMDRMLPPKQGHRAQPILFPLGAVGVWMVLLFWAYPGVVRGYLLAILVLLLVFTALRTRWMAALCGILLSALLLVDLTTSSRNIYTHPYQDAPACYYRYADEIEAAVRQAAGGRALVSARPFDRNLPSNLGQIFPLHLAGALYTPLTPHQATWWQHLAGEAAPDTQGAGVSLRADALQPALLHLMAVKVLLASPESDLYGGQWAGEGPAMRGGSGGGSLRMYTLDNALPRAYWVPGAKPGTGAPDDVALMVPDQLDPDKFCLAAGEAAGSVTGLEETALTRRDASCVIEEQSPEWLTLHVDAPAAGVTVLADSFAPGWIARVDGKRVPILRVNGLFRGVVTPAGPHTVEFMYQPMGLYAAAAASCGGLVIALIIALTAAFRRDRS